MGIDCGTERTGYGVIDSDGRTHRLVACGVIAVSPRLKLAARLAEIARGLRQVIAEHRPQAAAVEEVFHAVNVKSSLKLAHARGVALLAVAEAGLELGEYSPLEVKMSVVGFGRAKKFQVQAMIRSILALGGAEPPAEDASDALAAAVCHANRASAARFPERSIA
jgi:crossover junction endodeoxyribonuclease RuvC